jgi:hypothetical protein
LSVGSYVWGKWKKVEEQPGGPLWLPPAVPGVISRPVEVWSVGPGRRLFLTLFNQEELVLSGLKGLLRMRLGCFGG